MASLTFTKSGDVWIAPLPAMTGTLQVELAEEGKLQIYAAMGSLDKVAVPFAPGVWKLVGSNIPCKVSLDGMTSAEVRVSKEPTGSEFAES